ncbi:hypothetical protein BDR26DRAFT_855314 [Obelidium mucronatum]|nr:hypothetical protein BDR26DRAFT_855314 [Obelidium mucronatum]
MLRTISPETLVRSTLIFQKLPGHQRRVTCPFTAPSILSNSVAAEEKVSLEAAIVKTTCVIHSLFSSTKAHPDRLIYALAGTLFYPTSPKPFGGKKRTKPGYITYQGKSAQDLLLYIVKQLLSACYKGRDPDLESITFVMKAINEVLGLQEAKAKDELDERMLKGLKKSGVIEWFGAASIPLPLQHRDEDSISPRVVPSENQCSDDNIDKQNGSTSSLSVSTDASSNCSIKCVNIVEFNSVRSRLLLDRANGPTV